MEMLFHLPGQSERLCLLETQHNTKKYKKHIHLTRCSDDLTATITECKKNVIRYIAIVDGYYSDDDQRKEAEP